SDMFDLVADVERYPEFVPLCQDLTVRSRRADQGRETIVATMAIAYGPIREAFTSRVLLDPGALAIRTDYLDGPFRRMENDWSFVPQDEVSCLVRFAIDYEFRSRTLGFLAGKVFDRAFRKLAEA